MRPVSLLQRSPCCFQLLSPALPLFPSARWWISVRGLLLRAWWWTTPLLKQYRQPDTGRAAPQNHNSSSLPLTQFSELLKHAFRITLQLWWYCRWKVDGLERETDCSGQLNCYQNVTVYESSQVNNNFKLSNNFKSKVFSFFIAQDFRIGHEMITTASKRRRFSFDFGTLKSVGFN